MNFEIKNHEMEYTGGGCWVLFAEVLLTSAEKTIWASVSDELVALYHTKEDSDTCENAFTLIWYDEILYEKNQYNALAFALFDLFDKNRK